ncbi:MAG: hypothetical protein Kow00129_10650 [Thermoleophilia bacterium]
MRTVRESVRARLQRLIKRRVLRKYGYPPDKEKAMETVLEQTELSAAEWAAA